MAGFPGIARTTTAEDHSDRKNISNPGLTLFSLISIAGYFLLAYQISRTQTIALYLVFAGLFAAYAWLLQFDLTAVQLRYVLIAAIVFRCIFLPALPHLSDDYFRFIWDGRLSAQGINPFNVLPLHFVQTQQSLHTGVSSSIYAGLNSKSYYTIYPPVMQGIFWFGAKIFPHSIPGSIVVMRLFILLSELGTILLLRRLLIYWGKSEKLTLLYAWNPLVIAELTGNLHFEAVMIFFLLLSVYLLIRGNESLSALAFGLALSVKLLPLMFLPALVRRIGWKKTIPYGIISIGITGLLFLPFMDTVFLQHIGSSVGLYFSKFEFNASLFYLIRWLGTQIIGYDIIYAAGPALGVCMLYGMGWYLRKERKPDGQNIFRSWMWIWLIYLACSTIVHPWYVTPLVVFAVFSGYRFPIFWSGAIVLTYFTYRQMPYRESLGLVTLEYTVVFAVMVWELFYKRIQPGNSK